MKKLFSFLLIFISLLSFSGWTSSSRTLKRVIINQSSPPLEGPLFKAGDTISLAGQVDGDVFLVGGEVLVDAVINGDLIILGGKVDVRGQVNHDLRILGGQINLDAQVGDDVTLAGGQVDISSQSHINNSLTAAAGFIADNAQVNDKLWLGGGRVRFGGQAGKDALIQADTIDIHPSGRVNQDLKLVYGQTPFISDQAVIGGEVIQEKSPLFDQTHLVKDKRQFFSSRLVKNVTTFFVIQKLIALVLEILLGCLVIALLPKLAKSLTQSALSQPGAAIGWGFLALMFIPVIGMLLLISLIGIPLGVLVFILYSFTLYAARLVAGLAIGNRLFKDNKFTRPYRSFALGIVILAVLKLTPFIGWAVYFVLLLLGLGAITLEEKKLIRRQRK